MQKYFVSYTYTIPALGEKSRAFGNGVVDTARVVCVEDIGEVEHLAIKLVQKKLGEGALISPQFFTLLSFSEIGG